MKKDISSQKDIELLVNTFYEKVKSDSLIGRFFTEVVKVDWDKHIPVMVRFWDNALFFSGVYEGRPLEMHKHLSKLAPLSAEHFDRWNKLFMDAVDESFAGEKAELAKNRAFSISAVMQEKILHKKEKPEE